MIIGNISKQNIFGSLDVASNMVATSAECVEKLLNEGNIRLRIEDIDRALRYLKVIRPNLRKVEETLKAFKEIAP